MVAPADDVNDVGGSASPDEKKRGCPCGRVFVCLASHDGNDELALGWEPAR